LQPDEENFSSCQRTKYIKEEMAYIHGISENNRLLRSHLIINLLAQILQIHF